MKKTMIALAAAASLATSGAAFAQATITGFMAAGYQVYTSGGAATYTTGGFGVDTAELYFTAKEDIGGGMTAGGTMGIGGLERAGGYVPNAKAAAALAATGGSGNYQVYGHNYTMYVQNAMGKVTLGSAKSGDYVSAGLASSGVNYYDFGDFGNFGARSRRDFISLDVPMGPITLGLAHQEAGNQVGQYSGAEGSTGQRLSVVQASYAQGALKANTQYFTWDNRGTGNTTAANTFRLSGNYNLGMAIIGAGMQRVTYDTDATATNYGVSASVPMGPVTLGGMMGWRVTDGFAAAANGTLNSFSLNASYALGKRTGLTGQYSSWDSSLTSTNKGGWGMLLLTHSF